MFCSWLPFGIDLSAWRCSYLCKQNYIHTLELYIRVYLCNFYIRYLLFLNIFIVYDALFTYTSKTILPAPGVILRISVYSEFQYTQNFSILRISVYSEFQHTQNFSILRISVYSEFQHTTNFSILRISVYSEFQHTHNFSILRISAYSEFQYTQNFSILSVSLKFEIFDSDSEVSRVHSEVTVPPNFCHSPEAPSQT